MEELDEALQLLTVGREKLDAGTGETRVTTVYKPLVEAFFNRYHTINELGVDRIQLEAAHPRVYLARMRVYYELARANREELSPFHEWLLKGIRSGSLEAPEGFVDTYLANEV